MNGEAGAIDTRLQRAKIVRQYFGKHRYHTVGKVDRVAASSRFAIERGAGAHIPGHIGDRYDDMPPAAILGVRVGLGPNRIVKVTSVRTVDRDQREVA